MCLAFTRMSGERYRRRFRSFFVRSRHVLQDSRFMIDLLYHLIIHSHYLLIKRRRRKARGITIFRTQFVQPTLLRAMLVSVPAMTAIPSSSGNGSVLCGWMMTWMPVPCVTPLKYSSLSRNNTRDRPGAHTHGSGYVRGV